MARIRRDASGSRICPACGVPVGINLGQQRRHDAAYHSRHYVGPIAGQCSHWPRDGARCRERATVWIYAPDGSPVPGAAMCRAHGQAVHDEYREKLGEIWPLIPITTEIP